jgi:uncharacterized protein
MISLGTWGDLPLSTLAALFAVGMAGGFIDSIAGGSGLLCVPALLSAGLSPAQTLATNKLQGSFGTFSATLHFVRAGQVQLKPLVFSIATTFAGAVGGALAVQALNPGFLRDVLPILLTGVGLYFLLSPKIGEADRHQRLSLTGFALSFAPLVGFYDGFFGPGAGSLFTLVLVSLVGFNLLKATAHTKALNFTSNIASMLFFLAGGKMVWSVGLTMAVGQVIGARLGSQLVLAKGGRIVRPLLVIVSLAITANLVATDPTNWLHRGGLAVWRAIVSGG